MEFYEKLQELRKRRGLTQEELAEALYVSRTAVSKWESGRGYPNLDSLKAISRFFSVSLDDLLSSEATLSIAEADIRKREAQTRSLVFGALDCGTVLLLLLPFFAQRTGGVIHAVSLLTLTGAGPYVKLPYLLLVLFTTLWGVLLLALQACRAPLWLRVKDRASLGLSAAGVLLFTVSLQPYAAIFVFLLLTVKVLILIKRT